MKTQVALETLASLDPAGPAVVAIGGGHGLAQLLTAVQSYAGRIDAVVTVADDGGSSGRLTAALDIPPPGDLRKCLLALSPQPSLWWEVFDFRFEQTDVAGHSLGNLVLAALSELTGDFETALQMAAEALGAVGRVIPASRQSLHLQAVIDERLVDGQVAIATTPGRLSELRLLPADERANPSALEVIGAADQIIIGPGSLFTSVVSTLMVPDLAAAVEAADAQIVYVCNLTTQYAETLGLGAADHVRQLRRFTGLSRPVTALANVRSFEVPPPVERLEVDELEMIGVGAVVHTAKLADLSDDWPKHDPLALGQALTELWQETRQQP